MLRNGQQTNSEARRVMTWLKIASLVLFALALACGQFSLRHWLNLLKVDRVRCSNSFPARFQPISLAGPFRRPWVVETDLSRADFVIATERARCGEGKDLELIDRLERLGLAIAFAVHLQKANE